MIVALELQLLMSLLRGRVVGAGQLLRITSCHQVGKEFVVLSFYELDDCP